MLQQPFIALSARNNKRDTIRMVTLKQSQEKFRDVIVIYMRFN